MQRIRARRLRALASLLASLLTAALLVVVSPGTAQAAETADWLPFKVGSGVVQVGCTWSNGCDSGYHGYKAIDFIAPYGTEVYAAGPGTLQSAGGCDPHNSPGCNGSAGNYITITHPDGRQSRYLHLSEILKASGQVSRGDLIGRVGNSGGSPTPHLHYDEFLNGTRVDPGPMYTRHGNTLAQYPQDLNSSYDSWDDVPAWTNKWVFNDAFEAPAPPPPPDTDADGTPDSSDRCQRIPGPSQNRGCPLYEHTVTGQFYGNDGITDALTFYDYGNASIGAWVFPGTDNGTTTGVGREVKRWQTPNGTWDWYNSVFVAGNFAGNDAYTDVVAFFDHGSDEMSAWLFRGNSTGVDREQKLWTTGPGKWNMTNGRTFLVGNFAGNDGQDDILAFYNHGSDEMSSWVFAGNGNGVNREQKLWTTGPGKWNMKNSKFVTGEFNGSPGTDVLGFYDYGSDELGTWLFPGATTGVGREQLGWKTGTGQWNQKYATYIAGNFAGDDSITDVVAFYDYGSDELGAWTFQGNGNGVNREQKLWTTGPGKWNAVNSKWFALGQNSSGRTDVVAFYNHGTDNLGAWQFTGQSGGVSREAPLWKTGNNQWNWSSM